MKILVIQQKMLGDVLTSTILCENLKRSIPGAEIHYVVYSNSIPITLNNPYIDKIIEFKQEYRADKLKFYRFLKTFKKEPYDAVIDVYGKIESILITLFSRSTIKIGLEKWYTKHVYTHIFKRIQNPELSVGLAIENRLQLLKPLLPDKKMEELINKPKVYLSDDEKKEALSFFKANSIDTNKPVFMIGVLGSGTNKTYPFLYMASIIDEIIRIKPEATLIFNYIPSQYEDARKIYDLCSSEAQKQIQLDAFTPSLRKFLAVLNFCDAIIGNEGGSINMAKALQVPTFSIYSPWIKKESWGFFEDEKNKSVHFKEFKPELFKGKNTKDLKNSTQKLYQDFKPDYFKDILGHFLNKL